MANDDEAERDGVGGSLASIEEQLRVILRGSPILVAHCDRDLRYTWIHDPHSELVAERVRGMRDDELSNDAGALELMRLKREVLARGVAIRREIAFDNVDGDFVYDFTAEPLRDANGAIVGVTTAATEVTERKRVELELRKLNDTLEARVEERTESLRAILDTASDGIVTMDESGVIQTFNPAAQTMFGYTAAEAIGTTIHQLIPSTLRDDGEGLLSPPDGDAPKVVGIGRELFGQRKDGKLFPIRLGMSAMVTGGERKFTGIVHDLTEERRLEKKFQQAQRLQVLGTLASGVAHDFNNLLMGMVGAAEMALEQLAKGQDASALIQELRDAAQNGAAIPEQLLAFSRKAEVETKIFDLNAVVGGTEEMFRRLLGEDVRFRLEPAELELPVRCNSGQIEQVLMNLMVNARHAMPDGGEIRVRLDETTLDDREIDTLRAGRYARLSVSDTGCGMDERTLERVFEPFFTTKPVEQGSGLGLSGVYGIIKQGGGHIEVTSQPGNGSTFSIYLPLVGSSVPPPLRQAVRERAAPNPALTILLVEDDYLIRMTVRHYLESAGHRVLEAGSFVEGRRTARKYRGTIDVVVTDVVLPGGTGPRLAREIANTRPFVRTVLMSGHSTHMLVADGRAEPGSKSLQKPFTREQLLTAILECGRPLDARTALVVEDDAAARGVLVELLKELGYAVSAVADGDEALAAARRTPFDVLFTDLTLPGLDGRDLARWVRAMHPRTRLVFTSGYREPDLPDEAMFVAKPIARDALQAALQSRPI